MVKTYVEHKGKKYEVKEPTIDSWSSVMKLKDILEEDEMYLRMIVEATGMSREDVLTADALVIKKVGDALFRYINEESKTLTQRFSHKEKSYVIVDINNITFGQFVDVDSFLQKEEQYRIANLNELAAYLYCEEGVEYGKSNIKQRIIDFKDLPVKYIEGALFFLSTTGKQLHGLLQIYSQNKWKYRILKTRTLLMGIGAGISQLVSLPKTKFGRLIMWCLYPLLVLSTILLILWTTIVKKKKKLNNNN
jgi:hypothetical protein